MTDIKERLRGVATLLTEDELEQHLVSADGEGEAYIVRKILDGIRALHGGE